VNDLIILGGVIFIVGFASSFLYFKNKKGDINVDWSKFLSRKFLLAVGGIVVSVAGGLGMDVDPEVITGVAGGIAAVYIAVEGIIDKAKTGNISADVLAETTAELVSDLMEPQDDS
jgi:hypothetical protein